MVTSCVRSIHAGQAGVKTSEPTEIVVRRQTSSLTRVKHIELPSALRDYYSSF